MAVTVITPPATEPCSLTEIKAQLGQTLDTDDTLIGRKITAAREYVERMTGRTLIDTTLELVLDVFPRAAIAVPNGPLSSVTSVTYIAADGTETVLDSGAYTVDTDSDRIAPGDDGWPSTDSAINAVRVRYVAGYGDEATDVPEPLREAILLLSAHWYENREATLVGLSAQSLPYGVDAVINQYRVWSF